jgi:hypothetical protein
MATSGRHPTGGRGQTVRSRRVPSDLSPGFVTRRSAHRQAPSPDGGRSTKRN